MNDVVVVDRIPVVTGVNPTNVHYLETKRVRMGHMYSADDVNLADDDSAGLG